MLFGSEIHLSRSAAFRLACGVGAAALAAMGCGITQPGPASTASSTSAPAGQPLSEQTFQADVAPVAALAFKDPYLWIGSDRGLRRVRPGGGAEWVRPVGGFGGRRVSALTVDGHGHLMLATETGFGTLSQIEGPTEGARYQPLAALPGVTQLVAQAAGQGGGAATGSVAVWAGTTKGLFFFDRGRATAVDGAGGIAITSLDLDGDGRTVWAGLRGRGLVHVDAGKVTRGVGPDFGDHLDFVDSLGTAMLPNGTRIALGRGARGAAHIALLRLDGAELLVAQPDISAVALVSQPGGPLLIAGPPSAPRAFVLGLAERGKAVDEGGLRFAPARKNLAALRLVARPDPRPVPADITVAIAGGDDVFAGTRVTGVARLKNTKRGGADYLAAGELAMDARGLSVTCVQRDSCLFATGNGPGWLWDGKTREIKAIPAGAMTGGVMALAGDGGSSVYLVTGDGKKSLTIAGLAADGKRRDPVLTVPISAEGVPLVTFAALSPQGNLWLAVRDRLASGQELGRGAIEVQLPAGRSIHHQPYRETDKSPPEAIPIAGDVAAIRFGRAGGSEPNAIWFCTSVGVMRFVQGQLTRWGENEGLDSERCHDIEITADGTVWAATEAGAARFDGRQWLRFPGPNAVKPSAGAANRASPAMPRWPADSDGESVAARALVAPADAVWAGTPVGVWPLGGNGTPIDRAAGLIDDDVVDMVGDRFGRLWVLGRVGVTVRPLPR